MLVFSSGYSLCYLLFFCHKKNKTPLTKAAYHRKHLIRLKILENFKSLSGQSDRVVGQQAVACLEQLLRIHNLKSRKQKEQTGTGPSCRKPHLTFCDTSSMATPSPYQTVLPTGNQEFKYWSFHEPFLFKPPHSFVRSKNQPMELFC